MGLIDGNAPPFICLAITLGAILTALHVFREIESLDSGIRFKFYGRIIGVSSFFIIFIITTTILYRIIIIGFFRDYDFKNYDLYLLFGIFMLYSIMVINGLLSYIVNRKY